MLQVLQAKHDRHQCKTYSTLSGVPCETVSTGVSPWFNAGTAASAEVSTVAQPVEPVTSVAPPANVDMRATAVGAHDSSADLAAQPSSKGRKKSAPGESGTPSCT